MEDLNDSLFLAELTHEEFQKRYKTLLEEKERWPRVFNSYYKDRQNVARDLRYFRLASEMILLKGISPGKAIKTVWGMSTNDLDSDEKHWSTIFFSETFYNCKCMMSRDD